jgi:hypothetical protein
MAMAAHPFFYFLQAVVSGRSQDVERAGFGRPFFFLHLLTASCVFVDALPSLSGIAHASLSDCSSCYYAVPQSRTFSGEDVDG